MDRGAWWAIVHGGAKSQTWLSDCAHTHISILFQILFYYGLLQDIEYSSLCYTGGPCCLHICYTVACIWEKAMAPHSSTLAWKIPWRDLVGGAWKAAVHGVAEGWTQLSDFTFTFHFGGGHGNPLQCSCLENPRDGGAWWAAVYGVAQSRTRLKQLSSSSSSSSVHLIIPNSSLSTPLLISPLW